MKDVIQNYSTIWQKLFRGKIIPLEETSKRYLFEGRMKAEKEKEQTA